MHYLARISIIFSFLMLSCSIVIAQEHGEMLYFNGAPNIDETISENALSKSSDGVIFQSEASEESIFAFNRILFNGTLSDRNMRLQVRYLAENGNWSDWQEATIKTFPNGRFWARLDLESESTHQITYRLVSTEISNDVRIEIYAVEGLERKLDILNEPEAHSQPEPSTLAKMDTVPKPALVTRAEWGANPPRGTYTPHDPYRFAQHHTAGKRISTLADGIIEMQMTQDFHQNGRGWQDIGYHFLIDDAGRLYEGVPPDFRGTHAGGNNTGNIGISYMGNLHIAGENPTPAALESLIGMWSWLAFHYGVSPDSLLGHQNYSATACPGDNLYSELPDLRNGIRQTLGFGAPFVANPMPQPFLQEISPTTPILFFIRDAEEGVDINSIVVKINGEQIIPSITGGADQYQVFYQPAADFPSAQNVIIDIEAADLATPANVMQYSYMFKIRVEALFTEVENSTGMRNALLDLQGQWQSNNSDVILADLNNGIRLLASDTDGSHIAKIYPEVSESGDYLIEMAASGTFLGESAHYRFVNANGQVQPRFVEYNSVYSNQWNEVAPTPMYLEAGNPAGYIELSGFSDIPTRLVLDAFRLEKVDRLEPPKAPTLKWARLTDAASNQIEVAWYPSLEGDIAGYRLFMSEDGRTWDEPIADEQLLDAATSEYLVPYNGSSPSIYFQMVAVDTNTVSSEGGEDLPLLSSPSDIYGVGFNRATGILIVDNFDRNASWQRVYHPFARSHGDALSDNGYGFDTCTETAVQNGEVNLNLYDVVIYFCGDDSRADESLAAADQFRLQDYLESGGKLFISGSEIGYDFAATTAAENSRYQDLLKARYIGDLSGSNTVSGENNTVFQGLEFQYGQIQSDDNYIEDFPDYLQPNGGSQVALFYGNLRIAGIQYTGTYGGSSNIAQLVYLGFTFETINTADDRAALMERVMQYFGATTGIEDQAAGLPEQFQLDQNYPNPFNPSTTISYTLPTNSSNTLVKLEIFTILGQKVVTLVKEKQTAGIYSREWDGRNEFGNPVSSGVYYYRLTAENYMDTKKMIMLQ